MRRTLRDRDVAARPACLRQLAVPPAAAAGRLGGQAIAGQAVRGALAPGHAGQLVSLVRHSGVVLTPTAVADKAAELVAAPPLLAGRELAGTITTVDARLAQRSLAAQLRAQGGHDLLVGQDTQPERAPALTTLFATPPWLVHEQAAEYAATRTVAKGHGRLETRTLQASPGLHPADLAGGRPGAAADLPAGPPTPRPRRGGRHAGAHQPPLPP